MKLKDWVFGEWAGWKERVSSGEAYLAPQARGGLHNQPCSSAQMEKIDRRWWYTTVWSRRHVVGPVGLNTCMSPARRNTVQPNEATSYPPNSIRPFQFPNSFAFVRRRHTNVFERLGLGTRILGDAVFPVRACFTALVYHDLTVARTVWLPYLNTATVQVPCEIVVVAFADAVALWLACDWLLAPGWV